MFFFLSPLAEAALPLDDYAFIDDLWRDWSPGYDGSWDVARVKESIGDPERIVGRHRLLPGPVRPDTGRCPSSPTSRRRRCSRRPGRRCTCTGATTSCMLLSSMGSPLDFMAAGLRASRSSTTPATSSTWSGPTSSTAASSTSWPPQALRRSPQGPRDPTRARPPGEPLSHQRGAPRRSARAGIVGPAAAAGQRRSGARPPAQGVEQPPPALAVRAGRRRSAAAPSGSAATDRSRSPRRPPRARRTGGAGGSGRSRAAVAVQTVAPRSNMAWLNSQDRPAGTSRSPRPIAALAVQRCARHAARARTAHRIGVDRGHVVAEGERPHGARRVGPDAGQRAAAPSSSRAPPRRARRRPRRAARCRFSARRLYPGPTTAAPPRPGAPGRSAPGWGRRRGSARSAARRGPPGSAAA